MRRHDRLEVAAMGRTPKAALRIGLLLSARAWTATRGGRPIAMFGVVVANAIEGVGVPWFLGTDDVARAGRALLTQAPPVLAAMLDSSPTLTNLVSAANSPAIRLLGRWGFVVEDEQAMIGPLPFRRFRMERPHV